jgi:hypothetical protein
VRFHGVLQDPVPYAVPVEAIRHMLRDTEEVVSPKVRAILAGAVLKAKRRLMGE